MLYTACLQRVRHIGLVEYIPAYRGVIVGGDGDQGSISINGARHIVLVPAVIVADLRAIANRPLGSQVFKGRCPQIHIRVYLAVVRIAEEGGNVYVQRAALKRR